MEQHQYIAILALLSIIAANTAPKYWRMAGYTGAATLVISAGIAELLK